MHAVALNAGDDELNYAPEPVVRDDYRRRSGERLYQATVIGVRAVYAEAGQRCWTEREQLGDEGRRADGSVPCTAIGAVIGAVIDGSGRTLAMVGGAVTGGGVGNNVGRSHSGDANGTRGVQHCAPRASTQNPAYWEVTHDVRSQQHDMQVATPPGATVAVTARGAPRA